MGCRILDLTVIYARNLKDVDHISKMKVYVVVSLDGNPSSAQESKSPVDVDGGINPKWSFNVKLYVDERSTQQNCLNIHFKLRSHHRVLGDKDVGEVVVPVKELLDSAAAADGEASSVTYPVHMPSGKSKGELHFSYKFSDKLTSKVAAPGHLAAPKADVAIMGYPVPAGPSWSSGAGYLPSSPGAYASPPTPGYECPPTPPPPAGHGYAQPPPPGNGYYPNQKAQQAPKKNKEGLGLGVRAAGLFGGIGGIIGHAADAAGAF